MTLENPLEALETFEAKLAPGVIHRCGGEALTNGFGAGQLVVEQATNEIEILLATGDEFGYGEVMDFQAESGAASSVGIAHGHEPFLPARRQNGSVQGHPVGVVAKGLVKGRAFANGAVDQVGVSRIPQREHVGFDGDEQFGRRVWKLAEQGLWLPIMMNSCAPVMPAAARMMCSSCGLCMALTDCGLEGPDFGGREHAGKGRVLAQAPSLLGVGTKNLTDVAKRVIENSLPFAVAADEGGGVRVLVQPAGEIVAGDLQERRLVTESGCDPAAHLKAYLVVDLV